MEKQKLIFDVDGTLLWPDYSYEEAYFRSALSKEDAERFIPMIAKYISDYEKVYKRYDVKKLSRYLTMRSEILISEKLVRGWKMALTEINPIIIDGVVEALENLSLKGKKMVILTNWFLEPQIALLKKAGISDYFNEFYGGEFVLKPNPISYRIACGNTPIEECVMIGDSLDNDVYGAMNAGIDAIYYNQKNEDNFDKRKIKSIGSMKKLKEMF